MKLSTKVLAISAAIAVAGGVFGYFNYQQQKHLSSATYALSQVEKSLQKNDRDLFEKHVDTHKVSLSILSNMLSDDKTKEPQTEGLFEKVGQQLSNKLGKRVAAFVQPELSKNLQAQMITFVEQDNFGDSIDVSRLYGGKPMLQNLWEELQGPAIQFSAFEKVNEQGPHATAILPFERTDLEHKDALKLKLEKVENVWKVTSVDNLSQVLDKISEMNIARIEKINAETSEKMNAAIKVLSVEKSAGVSQWGVGKGLMLRAAFENISESDIESFHAEVHFVDENQEVIKTVSISDTDLLASGLVSEKSWPMGINPLSDADNYIYDATATSLTINVEMTSLSFNEGEKLELLPIEQ